MSDAQHSLLSTSRVARCRACRLERLLSETAPRPPAVCPACRGIDTFEMLPIGALLTAKVNATRSRPPNQYGAGYNAFPMRPWPAQPQPSHKHASDARKPPTPVAASSIAATTVERYLCGIALLDRACGTCEDVGSAVGDAAALSGPPGTGKSTLALQALAGFAERGQRCLLATGEEQIAALARRARRVGVPKETLDVLQIVRCEDYDHFATLVVDGDFDVALMDSMQTMKSANCDGRMRSISQIEYGSLMLADLAHGEGRFKGRERVIWAICHADKDGNMAGPNAARHHVDALYLLEHFDPETGEALEPKNRKGFVRAMIEKNRSGDAQGSTISDEDGEESALEFRWVSPPGRLEPYVRDESEGEGK